MLFMGCGLRLWSVWGECWGVKASFSKTMLLSSRWIYYQFPQATRLVRIIVVLYIHYIYLVRRDHLLHIALSL